MMTKHIIVLSKVERFWQVKCRCGARAKVATSEAEAGELIYLHRRVEGLESVDAHGRPTYFWDSVKPFLP